MTVHTEIEYCEFCGHAELECICEELSAMDLEEQLEELLTDEVTR